MSLWRCFAPTTRKRPELATPWIIFRHKYLSTSVSLLLFLFSLCGLKNKNRSNSLQFKSPNQGLWIWHDRDNMGTGSDFIATFLYMHGIASIMQSHEAVPHIKAHVTNSSGYNGNQTPLTCHDWKSIAITLPQIIWMLMICGFIWLSLVKEYIIQYWISYSWDAVYRICEINLHGGRKTGSYLNSVEFWFVINIHERWQFFFLLMQLSHLNFQNIGLLYICTVEL